MRLKAFVSDGFQVSGSVCERLRKLCRIANSSIDLSDSEIEKRERVIQTYLVVFGLLLSYDGDPDLQKILMGAFLLFLVQAFIYYSMLTTRFFYFGPLSFDLPAILMSGFFCYALLSCAIFIGHGNIGELTYPVALSILYYPLHVPLMPSGFNRRD